MNTKTKNELEKIEKKLFKIADEIFYLEKELPYGLARTFLYKSRIELTNGFNQIRKDSGK